MDGCRQAEDVQSQTIHEEVTISVPQNKMELLDFPERSNYNALTVPLRTL